MARSALLAVQLGEKKEKEKEKKNSEEYEIEWTNVVKSNKMNNDKGSAKQGKA